MTPDDFFRKIEAHRNELAGAGVRRLGVYGSVARGEARQDSDVDVLVEFDRTPDLFELAALREIPQRKPARTSGAPVAGVAHGRRRYLEASTLRVSDHGHQVLRLPPPSWCFARTFPLHRRVEAIRPVRAAECPYGRGARQSRRRQPSRRGPKLRKATSVVTPPGSRRRRR
ncbi:MAG: nucleotidyltransferase domain-containing protein [Rhizobiales bacterium]|nr:nucleotidyltransferase domain-containing protein [Hyphomicrobiales bacterium]